MESMPAVQQQVRSHARVRSVRRRGAAGEALPAVPGSISSEQPIAVNQFVPSFTMLSALCVLAGALTLQGLRHTRTRWLLRDAHPTATTAVVGVHAASTAATGLATAVVVGAALAPLLS